MPAKLMKYRALRGHEGDKVYAEGDIRIAFDNDVAHLIPKVLKELGPATAKDQQKAAGTLKNKAVSPPKNKTAS
jgi:hypothetical protein